MPRPNLIHTATGELARTGVDALRGLHLPYGLADRAAHTLVWSEAVHGCGLRFMRLHEDRIIEGIAKPFRYAEQHCGTALYGILDAVGKSVFESGPRAFDLATAAARGAGLGLVMVQRSFGTILLDEFVAQASQRDLGVAVICQAHDTTLPDCAFDHSLAMLGLPDGTIKRARLSAAAEASGLLPLLPLVTTITGAETAGGFLGTFGDMKVDPGVSNYALLAFRLPADGRSDRCAALNALFDEIVASNPRCHIQNDLPDRWARAVNEGFEVDAEDWQFLHMLVSRTRVATSERSQSQAG